MFIKNNFKYLIFLLLLIIMFSCNKKNTTIRAFYYWKTNLYSDSQTDSMLYYLHVKDLYVRYFDVEWSPNYNMPVPVGILSTNWYNIGEVSKIIPCIYITNDVFTKCSKTELDTLAHKIYRKILFINRDYNQFELFRLEDSIKRANKAEYDSLDKNHNYNAFTTKYKYDSLWSLIHNSERDKYNLPKEIQIDCDWTESTKDNYFYFLEKFKQQLKSCNLSSTLRLWQYKYRKKAGIPPVDRCMLMCYSVNSPKNYEAKNSIAEFDEIKSYIQGADYPIKLDVAFPIFNWGVLFRNNQFKGIVESVDKEVFNKDSFTYKKISENKYMFNSDTVIGNTYIRYGDEIKVEQVDAAELEKIIILLVKKLKLDKDSRVTFFSWNINYINNYGLKNIEKYYKVFEH